MHQPPGSSKWDVYKQAIIVSTEGITLRSYSHKIEFCIVFARAFLDINVS